MVQLIIGIFLGLIIGLLWPKNRTLISSLKKPFTEERKQFLIERMFRIFELCKLNIDEIDVILFRNSTLWNDHISWATNYIADLLMTEDLNVMQGNELFQDCYQAIHEVQNLAERRQ